MDTITLSSDSEVEDEVVGVPEKEDCPMAEVIYLQEDSESEIGMDEFLPETEEYTAFLVEDDCSRWQNKNSTNIDVSQNEWFKHDEFIVPELIDDKIEINAFVKKDIEVCNIDDILHCNKDPPKISLQEEICINTDHDKCQSQEKFEVTEHLKTESSNYVSPKTMSPEIVSLLLNTTGKRKNVITESEHNLESHRGRKKIQRETLCLPKTMDSEQSVDVNDSLTVELQSVKKTLNGTKKVQTIKKQKSSGKNTVPKNRLFLMASRLAKAFSDIEKESKKSTIDAPNVLESEIHVREKSYEVLKNGNVNLDKCDLNLEHHQGTNNLEDLPEVKTLPDIESEISPQSSNEHSNRELRQQKSEFIVECHQELNSINDPLGVRMFLEVNSKLPPQTNNGNSQFDNIRIKGYKHVEKYHQSSNSVEDSLGAGKLHKINSTTLPQTCNQHNQLEEVRFELCEYSDKQSTNLQNLVEVQNLPELNYEISAQSAMQTLTQSGKVSLKMSRNNENVLHHVQNLKNVHGSVNNAEDINNFKIYKLGEFDQMQAFARCSESNLTTNENQLHTTLKENASPLHKPEKSESIILSKTLNHTSTTKYCQSNKEYRNLSPIPPNNKIHAHADPSNCYSDTSISYHVHSKQNVRGGPSNQSIHKTGHLSANTEIEHNPIQRLTTTTNLLLDPLDKNNLEKIAIFKETFFKVYPKVFDNQTRVNISHLTKILIRACNQPERYLLCCEVNKVNKVDENNLMNNAIKSYMEEVKRCGHVLNSMFLQFVAKIEVLHKAMLIAIIVQLMCYISQLDPKYTSNISIVRKVMKQMLMFNGYRVPHLSDILNCSEDTFKLYYNIVFMLMKEYYEKHQVKNVPPMFSDLLLRQKRTWEDLRQLDNSLREGYFPHKPQCTTATQFKKAPQSTNKSNMQRSQQNPSSISGRLECRKTPTGIQQNYLHGKCMNPLQNQTISHSVKETDKKKSTGQQAIHCPTTGTSTSNVHQQICQVLQDRLTNNKESNRKDKRQTMNYKHGFANNTKQNNYGTVENLNSGGSFPAQPEMLKNNMEDANLPRKVDTMYMRNLTSEEPHNPSQNIKICLHVNNFVPNEKLPNVVNYKDITHAHYPPSYRSGVETSQISEIEKKSLVNILLDNLENRSNVDKQMAMGTNAQQYSNPQEECLSNSMLELNRSTHGKIPYYEDVDRNPRPHCNVAQQPPETETTLGYQSVDNQPHQSYGSTQAYQVDHAQWHTIQRQPTIDNRTTSTHTLELDRASSLQCCSPILSTLLNSALLNSTEDPISQNVPIIRTNNVKGLPRSVPQQQQLDISLNYMPSALSVGGSKNSSRAEEIGFKFPLLTTKQVDHLSSSDHQLPYSVGTTNYSRCLYPESAESIPQYSSGIETSNSSHPPRLSMKQRQSLFLGRSASCTIEPPYFSGRMESNNILRAESNINHLLTMPLKQGSPSCWKSCTDYTRRQTLPFVGTSHFQMSKGSTGLELSSMNFAEPQQNKFSERTQNYNVQQNYFPVERVSQNESGQK